jgi:hypothetical protein
VRAYLYGENLSSLSVIISLNDLSQGAW